MPSFNDSKYRKPGSGYSQYDYMYDTPASGAVVPSSIIDNVKANDNINTVVPKSSRRSVPTASSVVKGIDEYSNYAMPESPANVSKREANLESELSQQGMGIAPANLTNAMSAYKEQTTPTIPDIGKSIKEGIKSSVATPDMAKAAGELPKTKSGMKKFMDEYGKFIALGALSGFGGKKGMIAAPIMAALPGIPGILKMLQNRGKKKPGAPAGAPAKFPGYSEYDYMTAPAAPVDTINVAHGGLLGNKSAAHPKKKMAGGSIRKFSGGVMKKVTKKFAEGGEGKSDKRESAFNRLTPRFEGGLSLLGTGTPLRKDSISKKLLKEEDTRYRPFADSKEETNDKDMKMALASIIDEMFNAKNRMPAEGGLLDEYKRFDSKEYERPIVSEMYDEKYSGTAGVPYDSPSFKARQARQISPSVKVSGDKTPKKMVGGTVRKFKGGSMNTMKDNLMPKYKKGGDMPKGMPKEMMAMMGKKGKATGDMPEHKKMDMGMPIGKMPDSKKMGMAKPKPSSMDQKFAKGGTARYASGGMCKGYGMAKKIRPTGSMN